jgi:3-deoxy-D-manno-octulosonic-acid transferase
MLKFWFLVYNIAVLPLFWLIVWIYSLFNDKVKQGLNGRKCLNLNLNPENKYIIVHSSSLGEYQQSVPLIQEFLNNGYHIILSFFSPSGYNNAKITDERITKIYLPLDFYFKMKKFIDEINPEKIILIKYDLWFNFLYVSKKKGIQTIIANARYDENDYSWKNFISASFKKSLYSMIDKLFVIDEDDEKNFKRKLKKLNIRIIRVGDSKFERVYQSSKAVNKENLIDKEILKDKKVFVIGSSWKQDEDIIFPVLDKIINYENIITFLVPHEPKETKIVAIEKNIEAKYTNLSTIRFSDINKYRGQNIIIVDSVGKLMSLYALADVSYVGGGFKTGLHNILEPAIFNVPVIFNNSHKNSDEDELMIKFGCGIITETAQDFYKIFRTLLKDDEYRKNTGKKCKLLFENSLGTARKIFNNINLN